MNATMAVSTESHRWHAVLSRDPGADGEFVYAVRSTGVYCRPSCPSRRPRREQVTFFEEPAAAELAGFRACRRCHPSSGIAPNPDLPLVRKACAYLDTHVDDAITLTTLGRVTGTPPARLHRAFRRLTGITPREYRDARRGDRLRSSLRARKRVGPSVYEAGYGSSSRVYERADRMLGMTPATYAHAGRGALIRFTIVESPLGALLIAATGRGICRIGLGRREAIEQDFRREFAAATIERDDGALARQARLIVRHLDGRGPHIELPLDVRATAFQRRVWRELLAIPRGAVRSYAAVARAIGTPRATRAVARACATNPVALVIPCHRVVRADGGFGGYRWGDARKRRLLQLEGVSAAE
jgi:AraC family transcriptional regulator of adaptative response/methylated-DNA-[protein]-cysteine methyltransferase